MKSLISGLKLIGAISALVAAQAGAATLIAPGDSHLLYTGRVDWRNAAAPVLTWPGSSVEARFTGSSLAVRLDDQLGHNFFSVYLDGNLERPVVLQADKGERSYVVATGLAPGPHSFLLTKRTEGEEGGTTFAGLELADGGTLLAPPPRKQRKIEFFGDSITSGMGDESPDDGPDHLAKDKNNFLSFAGITARNLDAEAHFISQSGIGVMVSWFPFTMPVYFDQLNGAGKNDSKWDFSSWTPDVVVINLLQNDKWLIDREKKLIPAPDDAERVQRYRAFVQEIRKRYPRAYIVCALGSMDATQPGSKWPDVVRSAVAQIERDTGDARIATLMFPFTGYQGHPRVKQNRANAALLTAFIRQKLGW
jgi:hypothetical protein